MPLAHAMYMLYNRSVQYFHQSVRWALVRNITKHSSALYIGIAKVLPIIDVLGYDGQNSSFSSSSSSSSSSSCSDSTPITQKGSHIST